MANQNIESETAPAFESDAPDEEAIRRRAYEISQREDAGSDEENWRRAEAELRGAPDTDGQS